MAVVVNKIEGIIKNSSGYLPVNVLRIFADNTEEKIIASMVSSYLNDKKYKKEVYNSFDIEEENRNLFKAILYNNNIDANNFEGSLEIFEIE